MKKILVFLSIIVTFLLITQSCSKPESRSSCEVNNTGTVYITDNKDIYIHVWITNDATGYQSYDEYLQPGQTMKFNSVDAGSITIWEEDAYSPSGYWLRYLGQCSTLNLGISGKKKSLDIGRPDDENLSDITKTIK